MKLSAQQSRDLALPDLLNYSTVIEPGIVKGKDGSLIAGWYYRGLDHGSLTHDELNAISARVNDKIKSLDTGWCLQTDSIRVDATHYPHPSELFFPDPVTRLIDAERRKQYETSQHHYETIHIITLTYLPPSLAQSKLEDRMYANGSQNVLHSVAEKITADFHRWIDEFTDSLSDIVSISRMSGYKRNLENGTHAYRDQLVEYLSRCILGEEYPINIQTQAPFLDGVLGNHDFISGVEPIIGTQHLAVIAISGFPLETYPGILASLDSLPLEYRWSNRFIYMDAEDARKEINRFRKKWAQKQRGLLDQVFNTHRSAHDNDAVDMVDETVAAMADASSQIVNFGYYTSSVIIQSEDKAQLDDAAKEVVRHIKNLGFGARVETLNAVEAWLGSLPGHAYLNIRRPIIHTLNLVDLLPLSSIWSGSEHNPCDMYPVRSPALLYTDTTGATTFRLNLHVKDLGHTLIFGPTGSGKSTLLAMIAAQFRKYKGARFFGFDKGYSMYTLTKAIGSPHYDIAADDTDLHFCPLGNIQTDADHVWAEDWIRVCCELQLGREITPGERKEIHIATQLHASSASKTLTDFVSNIQNTELREALQHYTLDGAMGKLLDAEHDSLEIERFVVFEMEHLMNYNDKDKLPVLLYIFKRIESSLTGQPAMIMLDEAWIMLGHPVFREKIREWLKVLRKNNCAVVMATQSLSDAERSQIVDVLVESCPTKIYLPNSSAKSDVVRPFYERVGLNEAQIDILSMATPKRQYYVVSDDGYRLFELALGAVALAFVANSGKEAKKEVDRYLATHGDRWTHYWLKDRGINNGLSQGGFHP